MTKSTTSSPWLLFVLCLCLPTFPASAEDSTTNSIAPPKKQGEHQSSSQAASYVKTLEETEKRLADLIEHSRGLLQIDEHGIGYSDGQPKKGGELLGIREVLAAMHKNDAKEQASALLGLLRSDNAYARKHSSRLLGLLGDESVAGPLLVNLQNDEQLHSEAAEALGTIGNSGARALIAALKSDNKDVAIAAAKALGDMMPGERRPDLLITTSLINLLWCKNNDICDAAVEALGRYANTQSIGAIVLSMQDTNIYTSPLSSALALERIGRPCLPQLLDALTKCNTTNDADFARWSCAVLGDIGAVESIGALNHIAGSEWALPAIQDTKRPPYPMEIIKNDDPLSFWDWTHNRSIASLNRDLKYGGWRYDKHQGVDACAQATYALAIHAVLSNAA